VAETGLFYSGGQAGASDQSGVAHNHYFNIKKEFDYIAHWTVLVPTT